MSKSFHQTRKRHSVFNNTLEDKTEVFIKSVQELGKKFGIDYELIIKE